MSLTFEQWSIGVHLYLGRTFYEDETAFFTEMYQQKKSPRYAYFHFLTCSQIKL